MAPIARCLTLLGALLSTLLLGAASAAAQTAAAQSCDYAGQSFSAGATLCECPNLRIVRSAGNVGRGEITSKRLVCKDQAWVNSNTLCLVAYTTADHAEAAFRKFQASYCPRFPVNHADIAKAVSEETERFFAAAPRSQALIAVQAICRRFADLSTSCQAMIERLSASGN